MSIWYYILYSMLLVVNTVYGSMPQTGAFKKRKVAVGRGDALALDLSRRQEQQEHAYM